MSHARTTATPATAASGPAPAAAPGSLPAALRLQRAAGNYAVGQLLQAKLELGSPHDAAEQEADRAADAVMSKTAEVACSCGTYRSKGVTVSRLPSGGTPPGGVAPPIIHAALAGSGRPLGAATRAFMEHRFGRDFSRVRIHTDGVAAESARAIGARAYTVGNDVVFGAGQYAPESATGRRLLAHELAHVVQDSGGVAHRQVVQPGGPGTPGGPDPCLDLLQQIIELLNEVARRINDALDDRYDLYKYRPGPNPEFPDKGTWDGHADRFKYDRDRLRQKIAEWESNDDCRGYRLNEQQQEDFKEAREYAEKEFPEKPAKSMSEGYDDGESVWDKLRKYLPEAIVIALLAIGAYIVGAAIVACFASGACEFGMLLAGLSFLLVLGITAALNAAGVQDKSPPEA
jgi:hypothetical protein